MSYDKIRRIAEESAAVFERIAGVLDAQPGLEKTGKSLRERADQLRNDRFTIVVVGEFKRGKSTVLNAMLGRRILPQKATPCTAVLTVIRYGERAVRIVRDDNSVEQMSPEDFTRRFSLDAKDTAIPDDEEQYEEYEGKLRKEIDDRFGGIARAELIYPIPLCSNGIELVDSPGLSEHPARERRVIEFLRNADAVVMVLNFQQLLNQREARFIKQTLTPLGLRRNIFFLINRWNQLLEGRHRPRPGPPATGNGRSAILS